MHKTLALILALLCLQSCRSHNNWPNFRGPGSRGISTEKGLPHEWNDTKNIRWKKDISGRGWSSPVVWGDRVFVTTVTSQGEVEESLKGIYGDGKRNEPSPHRHEMTG